ncbi:MAG: hypothetical protein IPM39_28215 [Chloroflexi bacterium]|nr:hypothetical protein [Chloroflexota bacterium]
MKKKHVAATAVTLILFLFLLLMVWLLWPVPNAAQNDLAGVTITNGQEEAARQYALGLVYEEAGDWAAAQEQYAEAALSVQPEIQQAATAGLSRVLAAQENWRLAWWAQWRATAVWLSQVFFLLAIVAAVMSLAWLWRSTRQPRLGYLVQPVQDFTKDGWGNGLHHLLFLQLQTAQRTQTAAVEALQTQALAAGLFPVITPWQEISVPLGNALSVLEKVTVAGVNVSLRPFAQTLYTLWRQQEYTITAQMHQRGGRLALHVEIRHHPDGHITYWEIEGDAQQSLAEQRELIASEWAYRLMATQSDGDAPPWHALAAYVHGLHLWQRYREDGRYQPDLLQKALQQVRAAQADAPFWVPAQFTLGTLYNALGQYELAEATFRQLLATNNSEDDLPLRYNLGVSLYHQVEKGAWARQSAAEQFHLVRQRVEAAATHANKELVLLALTYAGLGIVAALEASPRIKKADWQVDPQMERLTAVQFYADLARNLAAKISDAQMRAIVFAAADHSDGFAQLQVKNMEAARDLLQQAIEGRPAYPVPYVNLADTYEKGSEEAITWLKRALDIQPGFAFGWFHLGQAYDTKSRNDPIWREAAREAFSHAVNFADAQERLGTIAFKQGDYQQAMTHYHTAVQLNGRKEHIWRSMAWRTLEAIEKRWIAETDATLRDALRWADQAVELTAGTENEWRAYDVRGWALRLLQQPQEALTALDQSIALKERAQNLYHRAQVHLQIGNIKAAATDLHQAEKYVGKDEKWRSAIQVLQQQLGDM